MEAYLPVPDLLVCRVVGEFQREHARALIGALEPVLVAGQRRDAVLDWEGMTGYESAARRELTEWTVTRRHHWREGWVCTGSKLVAMGITVASAAVAVAGLRLNVTSRVEMVGVLTGRLGLRR